MVDPAHGLSVEKGVQSTRWLGDGRIGQATSSQNADASP